MMPGRGRGGLGAADEGGWGVIYSKLNRGLWEAVKREKWKICYGLWFQPAHPHPLCFFATPKCDQPNNVIVSSLLAFSEPLLEFSIEGAPPLERPPWNQSLKFVCFVCLLSSLSTAW